MHNKNDRIFDCLLTFSWASIESCGNLDFMESFLNAPGKFWNSIKCKKSLKLTVHVYFRGT